MCTRQFSNMLKLLHSNMCTQLFFNMCTGQYIKHVHPKYCVFLATPGTCDQVLHLYPPYMSLIRCVLDHPVCTHMCALCHKNILLS